MWSAALNAHCERAYISACNSYACGAAAGCPAAQIQKIVQNCEVVFGCTPDEVRRRARVRVQISCALLAGVDAATQCSSPIMSSLTSCDEAGLAPCAAALSTCIENRCAAPRCFAALLHCFNCRHMLLLAGDSGGDPTTQCKCRGQYDVCYYLAGCPESACAAVVQACMMSGCTQQQCMGQ